MRGLFSFLALALAVSANNAEFDLGSAMGEDQNMSAELLEQLQDHTLDLQDMLKIQQEQDLDGVEYDLKYGFAQSEAVLDPKSADLEALEAEKNDEQFHFQAETSRLMDILVNSLYSDREVFIRELVSNASDALSKLKHARLSEGEHVDDQLAVYIDADKKNKTLTIFDNGIGMTESELKKNLGTIAHSGSHSFLEALAEGGDVNMIGQFGVGFYSAFLVADEVIVESKSIKSPDQYIWRSQASHGFTVSKVQNPDIEQGTRITLLLKPDATKFASPETIEKLVRTHSEFVDYPVFLKKKGVWNHVNPAKPIWQRPKEDITEEEHLQFFKKLSKSFLPQMKTIHYNGEGEVEFKSILYIPDAKDRDLFGGSVPKDNLKIYSRGVLISKEKKVLPQWLGFVHGVVEANDLPLKVDREQLSNSKEMRLISRRLTKKLVDTMSAMMKAGGKEAESLWSNYKSNFFLGYLMSDNDTIKGKLAKMFRFNHLHGTSTDDFITFADYIKANEDDPIYYMWTNHPSEATYAPILEIFKKSGKNVIFINGTIADQVMHLLGEYDGKQIISVEKGNVDEFLNLNADEEMVLARDRMMRPFVFAMMASIKSAGYSSFSKVELTSKLVESPSAIFAMGTGLTAAKEKHIRNQTWYDEYEMGYALGKKVLSINPDHPAVKKLFQDFTANGKTDRFDRGARMLYDFALLSGGHHLDKPELISSLLRDSISRDVGVTDVADFSPMEIPAEFYEDVKTEVEVEAANEEPEDFFDDEL